MAKLHKRPPRPPGLSTSLTNSPPPSRRTLCTRSIVFGNMASPVFAYDPAVAPTPRFTSIRDMVTKQAEKYGDETATCWVGATGEIERTLSFKDVERLSLNMARYLRGLGVAPGDRVSLIHAPSLDFFICFLGCQMLRAVPIPVPCPTPASIGTDLPAIISLLGDATPALTILHPMIGKLFEAVTATRPAVASIIKEMEARNRIGMKIIDAFDESLGGEPLRDERWDGVEGQGLAFMQYTSGSTSAPKGVMLSQRNLVSHLATIGAFMHENLQSTLPNPEGGRYRVCGWVPHWFDYSLVGVSLFGLHEGYTAYMMSPLSFMANPLSWMKAMAQHKVNISLAPNFAYGAVVRAWNATPAEKRPQLAVGGGADGNAWDLSRLIQLHSGGEPVQADVVNKFYALWKDSGLQPSSFRAAYGMAEHTLAITIPGISHDPLFSQQGKVAVGQARFGIDLRIVDPETLQEVRDGAEGEIWVDSASKAEGYWGKSKEFNDESFNAKLKGQANGKGYLRTGDLGFLVEKQLFISGRLKDVIILGGKNYFPADIEFLMEGYPGFIKSMAVSLPPDVSSGRYSIVYLVEVQEEFLKAKSDAEKDAYSVEICNKVVKDKGLEISTIVYLSPNAMPRTNTGKLGRATARTRFAAKEAFTGELYRYNAPVSMTSGKGRGGNKWWQKEGEATEEKASSSGTDALEAALVKERESLQAERQALFDERKSLKAERDALRAEREALATERQALRREREKLTMSPKGSMSTSAMSPPELPSEPHQSRPAWKKFLCS